VLFTSRDAVDGVATCDQRNKRGDASVRLVGTTNSQQIEVMEFALIVAGNGDNLSPATK